MWVSAAPPGAELLLRGFSSGVSPCSVAFSTSRSSQFPSSTGVCVCAPRLCGHRSLGGRAWLSPPALSAAQATLGWELGGLQTRSRVWHSPSRGSIQAVLSQGTSLQGLLCRAQHLPSVGWACTITPTHTANLLISKIHLLLFLPMGVGRCIARNFQLH